ncbi:unnamed protein product [Moneuplotes crassus]|uniref:Uncharacterized protein n=1 Tax=Euplotes crassus TaxID=5936 RepID=A0AAD2D305_EUPCR|nr:unnamed protein product [Moneuplotes crassus]
MNGLSFTDSSRTSQSFNRGRGGLRWSGEFRTSGSSFSHNKSIQPNFMPERDSLGSIGWGLSSRDDYGGPNKSHSSIKNILRSIKRAPTLVKSTDRFHIKKIDNSHRNSGDIGLIRLPGKFSSKIDRDLKMDYSTFTRMNLSYQKKCMQNIARKVALKTGKKSAAHLSQSSYHEEFPDGNAYPTLKSLIENPEGKTLVGFQKCSRYQKWKNKHAPSCSVLFSKSHLKNTRESRYTKSTYLSRRHNSEKPPVGRKS